MIAAMATPRRADMFMAWRSVEPSTMSLREVLVGMIHEYARRAHVRELSAITTGPGNHHGCHQSP
jgi:hypothetical protein